MHLISSSASGFWTRSDTNQAVQPQEMARGLKFRGIVLFYVVKTKTLIRCTVTLQLICAFVFTYAESRFSHDTDQIMLLSCFPYLE